MWRVYDFECSACAGIFEDMVKGVDGLPSECSHCECPGPFTRLPACAALPTTVVMSYPGSKKLKAGYVHSHGDRPAEKAGSQVSMYIPKGKK